ncbi:MAG: chromosome segregation protein, partial [Thermoleophilaceae bacterium]|nr:chromosome segregation protein [Thermoleophilaceae bacterium]
MHLRSISLKGFKSFPDRTKLEFTPGVAVIVGPNGSGKSNVTDAVLWALGEQSPLAVRGQSMQDVIFAGGHGLPSRNAAEVEVVIDNSDGGIERSEFSEISIVRRLDREGDGEYRLNGARCRLVDVIDVLSDTGLGKEMHSVVSQGRVEGIIHSKPRDRRLLIEEAAGLGKHRKRRRRAQLKLERTQDNLARALDVEREARSRLRPLKRQAEAAELHARIERQSLEARLDLSRDALGRCSRELAEAEAAASEARTARDEAERLLGEVAARRQRAEEEFSRQARSREALAGRAHAARSASERISMRLERARDVGRLAVEGSARRQVELEALESAEREAPEEGAGSARIAQIEDELSAVDSQRARALEEQLAELAAERDAAEERRVAAAAAVEAARGAAELAEREASEARAAQSAADRALEAARREAASVGAELASVNQYLRSAGGAPGGARSLADELGVEPGFEQALAAVLGPLLRAGLVEDVASGVRLLDAARDGGSALLLSSPGSHAAADPPAPGARRLLELLRPSASVEPLAARLLADAWIVDSLDSVPDSFRGVAATRDGRVLFGSTGEIRRAPGGGEQRVLEQRNRREELMGLSAAAAQAEADAQGGVDAAREGVGSAYAERDRHEGRVREAVRAHDEAAESVRRAEFTMERRREAPDEGPLAVRHAELTAELRAERRLAEQAERERTERRRRIAFLRARIARDAEVVAFADRISAALEGALGAVGARREALAAALQADEAMGESVAAELKACASEEAGLQSRLRYASESVTKAEVRAQQVRDAERDARLELDRIAEALGFDPEAEQRTPLPEPLADSERTELATRVERLARRREQLGPVNPLAKAEYEEAVAHVEELEQQRSDMEAALAELEGLIKETDRRIRESFEQTFEAAAKNFEETVAHLFPGGRGRLRLVQPDGPRPVLGGAEAPSAEADEVAAEAEEDAAPDRSEPGVEIEVTPAGKATKRLSLMSGGEKSLVALAFLFAVFLARPCPFYILDEVEAALDDANIDRFLQLVRQFSDRAQFIIVTHQKRTMDAADCLYGVSM